MVLGAGLKFTVVQSQQRSFEWGCTKETQTRKRNFWGMLAKTKKSTNSFRLWFQQLRHSFALVRKFGAVGDGEAGHG